MAKSQNDADEVEVKSRQELRSWLGSNHAQPRGVWLVHYKKSSPYYIPMGEIVSECLAHGWVDSLVRSKDDIRTMHWIAPRKLGSNWSGTNKGIVARLDAEGLMTKPGKDAIERAKSDGSWTRLDAVERLEVPDDLSAGFDNVPGSRENWEAFPRSVKRSALEWLLSAKRAETRTKRIFEIVQCSHRNERPNQWR